MAFNVLFSNDVEAIKAAGFEEMSNLLLVFASVEMKEELFFIKDVVGVIGARSLLLQVLEVHLYNKLCGIN